MMQPGALDRLITIEAAIATDDGYQRTVAGWTPLARVWARYVPTARAERFEAAARDASIACAFTVRWSELLATVTTNDRVWFEGKVYDIVAVTPIGRNEMIELMCTASGRAGPDDA